MTPGRTHHVLAPETPKGGSRGRKSDGVHYVKDSPDVAAAKMAAAAAEEEEDGTSVKTTPRRMNASIALRRQASFYSDNVSRNLLRAEAMVEARRFGTQAIPGNEHEHGAESSCESQARGKRASLQMLFPHLTEATQQQQQPPMRTPKKNGGGESDVSPAKSQLLFSPGRKVAFNMARQLPTPRGKGKTAGILKTPSKSPAKAIPAMSSAAAAEDPLQRYQERIGTPLKEQIQPRSPWSVDTLHRGGSPSKDRLRRRGAEIQQENRVIRQERQKSPENDAALIPLPDTPVRKLPSQHLRSPQSSPSKASSVFEPIPDATVDDSVTFIPIRRRGGGGEVGSGAARDGDGGGDQESKALGRTLEKRIGKMEHKTKKHDDGGKSVVVVKLQRIEVPKPAAEEEAPPVERRNSGRKRSTTARLGIDDVSLGDVLTPNKDKNVVRADGDGHARVAPGKEGAAEVVSQAPQMPASNEKSRLRKRKLAQSHSGSHDDGKEGEPKIVRLTIAEDNDSPGKVGAEVVSQAPQTPASNKKSRLRKRKPALSQSGTESDGKEAEPNSVRLTIAEDSDSHEDSDSPGIEGAEVVSQADSGTPSRHSARKRHLTERLGIDDISLSVVISPRSNLRHIARQVQRRVEVFGTETTPTERKQPPPIASFFSAGTNKPHLTEKVHILQRVQKFVSQLYPLFSGTCR